MTEKKMEELNILRGDPVLLKGKSKVWYPNICLYR